MAYLEASAQGRLLKIRSPFLYTQMPPEIGGKRGEIMGFSRQSRKRMLDMVATLTVGEGARFVTLTYADDTIPDDGQQAKAQLRALFERMRRAAPEASAVWRMELKPRKSGKFVGRVAPHFHMLVFNADALPMPSEKKPNYSGWFHEAWEAITDHHAFMPDDGKHDLRTDDKKIRNDRQAMYYVAKYAAKVEEVGSTLVSSAYPHVGRSWGVHNREKLPSCPLQDFVGHVPGGAYDTFRQWAATEWPEIASMPPNRGFTLYVDDALLWLEFLGWCKDAFHPSRQRPKEVVKFR